MGGYEEPGGEVVEEGIVVEEFKPGQSDEGIEEYVDIEGGDEIVEGWGSSRSEFCVEDTMEQMEDD